MDFNSLREEWFPASELARLKIGPVAMRDELEYFREVGLLQEIVVTNALFPAARNLEL